MAAKFQNKKRVVLQRANSGLAMCFQMWPSSNWTLCLILLGLHAAVAKAAAALALTNTEPEPMPLECSWVITWSVSPVSLQYQHNICQAVICRRCLGHELDFQFFVGIIFDLLLDETSKLQLKAVEGFMWCCYLQLIDHLVKQFSSFRAVGILKVVLYTNLNHDGLQVAADTYMSGRRIQPVLFI